MGSKINGGKRAQDRRAAATVRELFGTAETEIARHRAELARLIDAGQVDPIFGATNMRRQVFEGWLQLQDLPDPTGAFVALCRDWYREMKPEIDAPAYRPSSTVREALVYLDGRTTKPSRAEIDAAIERGEVSFRAGTLARVSWDLRQRCKIA